MKTKLCVILVTLTAIVMLGACRKSTNSNANRSSAGTMQETAAGGAATVGDKFYFRGRINYDLKVEMTLVRDGDRLTGTYFYPRVGKNIDLKGTVSKDGNVECANRTRPERIPVFSRASGLQTRWVWLR